MKVVANTSDTIRIGSVVTKSAGYISAAAIGDLVKIKCINATEWIAEYCVGSWTVETA